MVRVDDSDRVFDVSRPGRASPDATSRPLIVGHRPQAADHTVNEHEDDPYADYGMEKKVTPVPVTWDGSEESSPPTPIAEHPESAAAFQSPPADHAVATEPEVETETATAAHNQLPNTDTLFAPDHNADKSSWTGDGHPPVTALPLGHAAGAGPRRSWKKISAWLAGLLVLAGIGGYLAIDAGLVGANIKLPYEFFKEKEAAPAVTPVVQQPVKNDSATLKTYENKALGIKFDHPSDWTAGYTASAREPFVGTEYGDGHEYLGYIEVSRNPNNAPSFPLLYCNIFANSPIKFEDLKKSYQQQLVSTNPFKTPMASEQYDLPQSSGKGFLQNQVVQLDESYSDIVLVNQVGTKYFDCSYREYAKSNSGTFDYAEHTDEAIKIAKSFSNTTLQ